MVDQPNAIWMPNSNYFANTGKKSFIILHGTAGGSSAEGIANFFKSTEGTNNPASTHYIIGQDGHIVQTVLEKDGAFGNGVVTNENWTGNPNYYTISIEHVKSATDNSNQLTDAQKKASFKLIKAICERHGIGKHDADNNTGITSHASIDPVSRSRCPGPYPWDELWAYLKGEQQDVVIDLSTPGVSQFFEGDPAIWKCKQNGLLVGHGILDFYRKFGNNALCGLTHLGLPLTGETYVEGKPGFVYQRFERGVVAWDPGKIIDTPPGAGAAYLMHIDSGIGQDPRVAILQRQVDKLIDENADLDEKNDELQKKLDANQMIPQSVLDDIAILDGNVAKLKQDAGV